MAYSRNREHFKKSELLWVEVTTNMPKFNKGFNWKIYLFIVSKLSFWPTEISIWRIASSKSSLLHIHGARWHVGIISNLITGTTIHVVCPTQPISCLQMLCWLLEPGHKRAWYWPPKLEYSVSSFRRVNSLWTSIAYICRRTNRH